MNKIAAFDIGGTNVEYELLKAGKTLKRDVFKVLEQDKNQVLRKIADIVDEFAAGEKVEVKLSSPTAVNSETGFCKGISGIKDYGNFNLYEELSSLIKSPCKIKAMNDANTALLGIINTKFDKKPKSALMISLGTGIGGAVYIDNQIYPGHDGMAGEIGYPIWKEEKNISQSLSPVNFFKKLNPSKDGKEIFDCYLSNQKVTEEINVWLEDMAKVITIWAFTINPEVILFTGGVTKNKTFQMVLYSMYHSFLAKNKIDNLLSTKLLFFEEDINYGLEGAKLL